MSTSPSIGSIPSAYLVFLLLTTIFLLGAVWLVQRRSAHRPRERSMMG